MTTLHEVYEELREKFPKTAAHLVEQKTDFSALATKDELHKEISATKEELHNVEKSIRADMSSNFKWTIGILLTVAAVLITLLGIAISLLLRIVAPH